MGEDRRYRPMLQGVNRDGVRIGIGQIVASEVTRMIS